MLTRVRHKSEWFLIESSRLYIGLSDPRWHARALISGTRPPTCTRVRQSEWACIRGGTCALHAFEVSHVGDRSWVKWSEMTSQLELVTLYFFNWTRVWYCHYDMLSTIVDTSIYLMTWNVYLFNLYKACLHFSIRHSKWTHQSNHLCFIFRPFM